GWSSFWSSWSTSWRMECRGSTRPPSRRPQQKKAALVGGRFRLVGSAPKRPLSAQPAAGSSFGEGPLATPNGCLLSRERTAQVNPKLPFRSACAYDRVASKGTLVTDFGAYFVAFNGGIGFARILNFRT